MATPTNIIHTKGRWQFQGLFSEMWVVEADVDWNSIQPNEYEDANIIIPGLKAETDFVISFNREDNYTEHALVEVAHVHDDKIHLLSVNVGGGPFNAPNTKYHFLIGRMIPV